MRIREEQARIAQEENERLIEEWGSDFATERAWVEGNTIRFFKNLEIDKDFRAFCLWTWMIPIRDLAFSRWGFAYVAGIPGFTNKTRDKYVSQMEVIFFLITTTWSEGGSVVSQRAQCLLRSTRRSVRITL